MLPNAPECPPMESTPQGEDVAGQPQEPWQSYSPPSADKNTFAYPQPGGQGYDQARTRPTFPGQTVQDQAYQAPQGQAAPPWQEAQGMPHAAPAAPARPRTSTPGFFAALFDFGFNSFVTPKIIKMLYVLITAWTVIWALIFLRLGFRYGGAAGGIFTLVVVDPLMLLLTLGVYRVVLELFMVVHRIHEDLRAIRERSDQRG